DLNAAAALLALGRRFESEEILNALEPGLRALGDPGARKHLKRHRQSLATYRRHETPQFVAGVAVPRFLADAEEYARRGDVEERLALLREASRQAATLPPMPITLAAARAYAEALLDSGRPDDALAALAGAAEASAALGFQTDEATLRLLEGRA